MLTAVTCLTNTFSMKQQIILLQQHRKSLSTSALTLETKKKIKISNNGDNRSQR